MLPKDILKLIIDYNENGIFVLYNNEIKWFNGKRFEVWNVFGLWEHFTTYKNKLYISYNLEWFVYKNKTFVITARDSHLFINDLLAIVYNNQYQLTAWGTLKINGIEKTYPLCGYKVINYSDDIYVFGSENERFNMKTDSF